MSLAFGLSNFDEIVRGKPSRSRQDWRGDSNFVMPRKPYDYSGGSIIDGSEALCEIDKRGLFNPLRDQAQNVVEDFNLLVAKTIGVMQK